MAEENNQCKRRGSALCLCIILLFISIFCSACTNKEAAGWYSGIRQNMKPAAEKIDTGEWIVSEDVMDKPRDPATANLLPDGNVLIMGGENNSADTAEIFDPIKMKIIKSISLNDKRYYKYISVSLPDGDVFIAGGYLYPDNNLHPTNTAKKFNSRKYIFENIKSMKHYNDIGIDLKNGQVLLMNNIINPGAAGRENMRFQVYDSNTNSYFDVKNMIHKTNVTDKNFMTLENGNILFTCYGSYPNSKDKSFLAACIYDVKENRFKKYEELIPTEQLFIPLDTGSYLSIKPELTYSSGFVYNLNTKQKIPVNNNIPRTWRAGIYPQTILLDNGNVLILGINLVNSSTEYETSRKNRRTAKYSAYIYDRKKNIFYEVQAPPYPVYNAGIVKLKNGDVLIAGGRIKYNKISDKIQIFKYKH